MTDIKIIDLALKYQYDSPISFTNSFKKMHGISPQNLRRTKQSIKTFPKIEFKPIIETIDYLEYRIEKLNKQKLYGITTGIIKVENSKAIQDLFSKLRKEKILDFIINNSDGEVLYYGVSKDIISDCDISKKIKY